MPSFMRFYWTDTTAAENSIGRFALLARCGGCYGFARIGTKRVPAEIDGV